MDVKVFLGYMNLCEVFNWNPCFKGVKAYEQQLKQGLRQKWCS